MSTATDTYTLAQHHRDHFHPGNVPADCRHCQREAIIRAKAREANRPDRGDDYASPFPGLTIAIPASLTIITIVLWAAAWASTGAPLNGFTVWALIGAGATALGIAIAERQVRHGDR